MRETRALLARIEDVLRQEGEIVLTRYGKPVARILPIDSQAIPPHADLRAELPQLPDSASKLILQGRAERT